MAIKFDTNTLRHSGGWLYLTTTIILAFLKIPISISIPTDQYVATMSDGATGKKSKFNKDEFVLNVTLLKYSIDKALRIYILVF